VFDANNLAVSAESSQAPASRQRQRQCRVAGRIKGEPGRRFPVERGVIEGLPFRVKYGWRGRIIPEEGITGFRMDAIQIVRALDSGEREGKCMRCTEGKGPFNVCLWGKNVVKDRETMERRTVWGTKCANSTWDGQKCSGPVV
jgi:hypothetical protein